MDFFRQVLHQPFTELRWENQLLAALVILCCAVLTVCAVVFAVRSMRQPRLHARRPVGRPVFISWRDGVGLRQSDDGFCRDISAGGMALDLPFPLKPRTELNLRMSEAKFSGTGVVRRCTRAGPRYLVGVKFDRLTRALVNL
jgi:hypothetical protein